MAVVITCDICSNTSKDCKVYQDVTISYEDFECTKDVCEECLTVTLRSLGHYEAPSVWDVVVEPKQTRSSE